VRPDPDPLPILAALGVSAPNSVTRVSGGWDTSLWRVESRGHTFALRVFRPEQEGVWRREAVVLAALLEAGLPVPSVHAARLAHGRPALLLAWCGGRTLLQELQARPWRVWRLGAAMGRMHARIHSVPVTDAMAQALRTWTAAAEDVDPTLREALRESVAGPRSVLHLDFHPLNLLTDGRAITCVLDWANVAIGDRRADLARTVTLLRLAPMPGGAPRVLQYALRRSLEVAWRRGYAEGQPVEWFANLDPFYVWAGRMMVRDLQPKLGRPGVWLKESDLDRIRRWTTTCAERTMSMPTRQKRLL
jgi:aminoglycoside phosphotransferase (APT) family kinase protein